MNKIILSSLIVLGIIFAGNLVLADSNSVLSFSPATATENTGSAFSASLQLNPQGNQVCIIEGTVNFNNLTCKGIEVASGLMAQTIPTCASPSFILGIPKCTTAAQNILTVSVKGSNPGQATVSINSQKIVGVGAVVASTTNQGVYNIVAVSAPVSAPEEIDQTQTTQPTQTSVEQTTPVAAGAVSASPAAFSLSKYFWPLLIVFVVICIGCFTFWFVIAKKRKKDKQ